MSEIYPCLSCAGEVRPRQEGVQCDVCNRWQHRTCGTGVSRLEYLEACALGNLEYTCYWCQDPTQNVLGKLKGIFFNEYLQYMKI